MASSNLKSFQACFVGSLRVLGRREQVAFPKHRKRTNVLDLLLHSRSALLFHANDANRYGDRLNQQQTECLRGWLKAGRTSGPRRMLCCSRTSPRPPLYSASLSYLHAVTTFHQDVDRMEVLARGAKLSCLSSRLGLTPAEDSSLSRERLASS